MWVFLIKKLAKEAVLLEEHIALLYRFVLIQLQTVIILLIFNLTESQGVAI